MRGVLAPSLVARGYALMIHLFLDDSGKESAPGMPYVCMAGYLSELGPLQELNQKWLQLLIKHGIREIHMRDLIPLQGQYAQLGWDKAKRDEVLADFVEVVNETRMVGAGVAVDTAALRYWKKQYPRLAWGTVQQFCLERILSRVILRLSEAGVSEQIALVFDTDPEFGAARFGTFCALMGHDQRAARRLSSITFGHPIYYPGLQCADLLAWETRREQMHGKEGQKSTRRWRQMFAEMPSYRLDYPIGEKWDHAQFEASIPEIIEKFSALRVPSRDERSS